MFAQLFKHYPWTEKHAYCRISTAENDCCVLLSKQNPHCCNNSTLQTTRHPEQTDRQVDTTHTHAGINISAHQLDLIVILLLLKICKQLFSNAIQYNKISS